MRSKTKLSALAILLGTALAIPALAQTGAATTYPACSDPPPKLTPAQLDAAHVVFQAGQVAYDEGDYGKAAEAFKDAYRRDCSKTALLVFISKAYELKGDKAEAINALETYLKRNPKADDAESIRRRIESLKAGLATATATATTTQTAATIAPTATATVTPPPLPDRTHTAGPWVVVAIGGVALIPGVILTIVGQGNYKDASSTCQRNAGGLVPGSCGISDKEVSAKQDSALILRGVGIGLLAGGGALVIGGLIWHFLEPTGPQKPEAATLRFIPQVQPGYGGMLLSGTF
ncbi:hypothetical protein BH09MYX1_BH09MYX1_05030 [soil metagenome]